jgi:hypothetical protein
MQAQTAWMNPELEQGMFGQQGICSVATEGKAGMWWLSSRESIFSLKCQSGGHWLEGLVWEI